MGLPEVFYGNNHLYCVNAQHNFLFEICPVQSISLTSYAKRTAYLRDPTVTQTQAALGEDEKALNLIDLITEEVEVKEAQVWKQKDVSKIKDFTTVEIISDWTFSSAYKGSVRFLTNHWERIKNQTALQINLDGIPGGQPPNPQAAFRVELTDEGIPFDRLGQDNPIVHFGEIYLHECDLEDSGYTMGQARFRVMNDCFYILLRSYVRVDGVRVRLMDTRIFHDFTSNYLLREFTHKEGDYTEIRANGFNPSSEWMLS